MSGSLGDSLYRTPGMAEAAGALISGLGGGRDEGARFRNLAYAESARSSAAHAGAQADALRLGTNATTKLGDALAAGNLTPETLRGLAGLVVAVAGANAPSVRAGLGLASSGFAPGENAAVVGSIGGDAGNTRYGVDQRNATAIRQSGIAAGATVSAARIAQDGANGRQTPTRQQTPLNPGTDGLFLTPDQMRFRGMPVPEGTVGPTFVPGAANIPAGTMRVSPAPGTPAPGVLFAPPVTTTAPNRPGNTPGAAAGNLGEELARGLASPDPATRAEDQRQIEALRAQGITLPGLLTPTVATAAVRADSGERVAAARREIDTLRLEQQRVLGEGRIDLARDLQAQISARVLEVTRLQQEGATGRTVLQQDGAGARTAANIDARGGLETLRQNAADRRLGDTLASRGEIAAGVQAGAGERTAANIAGRAGVAAGLQAGAGERTAANNLAAGERGAASNASRERVAADALAAIQARPPRPLAAGVQDDIGALLANSGLTDTARSEAGEVAARLMQGGEAATADRAVSEAIRMMTAAGRLQSSPGLLNRITGGRVGGSSLDINPGAAPLGPRGTAPPAAPAAPQAAPPAGPRAPVAVASPAQAARLDPGTPYRTPDGREFIR